MSLLNLLLVEDDKELRATLAGALRVEGYVVQTAASLSDGLALLALSPVDLVLLDLGLPDGDGESLVVDLGAHRVSLHSVEQRLTPTEFKLLARLVRSAGKVVTHRSLLADV